MSGGWADPWAAPVDPDGPDTPPGLTRFDVVCHPEVIDTVLALTRRWGTDRVLSEVARVRLQASVRAAMDHGVRFNPRAVTVLIRWVDADRVGLDLRWLGCSSTAQSAVADGGVEATISTLDALAERWGFGSGAAGWILRMVIDTR